MRSFYEQNEKIYYCESSGEVVELAAKLPEGAIIECHDGTDFKVYIVRSDAQAKEL